MIFVKISTLNANGKKLQHYQKKKKMTLKFTNKIGNIFRKRATLENRCNIFGRNAVHSRKKKREHIS